MHSVVCFSCLMMANLSSQFNCFMFYCTLISYTYPLSKKSEGNGLILREIVELAVGNDDDNGVMATSDADGR